MTSSNQCHPNLPSSSVAQPMSQPTMSQPTLPLSSYSSIIPRHMVPWQKLDETQEFSLLHRRFWGMPFKNFQSKIKSEKMDVDEEIVEEDEDDTIDTDDYDYILDVGIEGVGSQIYVRKEFVRFFDLCKEYLDMNVEDWQPCSLVITGQPGIGKTCWNRYVLCRCLSQGKPIIWYSGSQRILFVKEGVYVEPQNLPFADFITCVWTLVDADNDLCGMPSHLMEATTRHLLIFTTSHQPKRWKRLHKYTSPLVYIMNPWSKKEILQASSIYGLTNKQVAICDAYDQYGPTPRVCLELLKRGGVGLKQYRSLFEATLDNLSLDMVEKIAKAINEQQGDIDDVSHRIILLRRRHMTEEVPQMDSNSNNVGNEKYMCGTVVPISGVVEEALQVLYQRLDQTNKLKWYNCFSGIPTAQVIASWMYEKIVHEIFLDKIILNLFSMKPDQNRPWKSTHGDASVQSSPLKIQPTQTTIYGDLKTIDPQVLHILLKRNQAGFDSFIMTNNILYIFQIIAWTHDISAKILNFYKKFSESLPQDRPWNFVFVVPTYAPKLSCPQPQVHKLQAKLRGGMKLFSAVLDPNSIPISP